MPKKKTSRATLAKFERALLTALATPRDAVDRKPKKNKSASTASRGRKSARP